MLRGEFDAVNFSVSIKTAELYSLQASLNIGIHEFDAIRNRCNSQRDSQKTEQNGTGSGQVKHDDFFPKNQSDWIFRIKRMFRYGDP